MKKFIFIVVLLLSLFFFRDELNQYWIQHSGEKVNDPIAWFLTERNALYNGLPNMGFTMYIEELRDFERKISTELNKHADKDISRGHRRNLVCELAVVHKKMAMRYLQNGDTELYMEHIRLSQEQLAECANPNFS